MTKYLCLTHVLAGCCIFAKAQSGKDSVLNVIATEVCAEIGKKDFSGKSSEELQMDLGFTIIPSITSRMNTPKKYYPIESLSKDDIGQVAEDVGMKLVLNCPAFMKIVAGNPSLMTSDEEEENTAQKVSGTFLKIIPGDFTYFQVKDADGKIQKVWWLEYFDGADKLTDELINKPVTITYTVKETYNAQLKEY